MDCTPLTCALDRIAEALRSPDWLGTGLSLLATLVAAGIALGGLLWVFRHERRERADERFDTAVAELMRAIGDGAEAQAAWLDIKVAASGVTPELIRNTVYGGPLHTGVNTAADIAWMQARTPDRLAAMKAVADATYSMGLALTIWSITKSGELVADIRKWRTGELTQSAFIEKMNLLHQQATRSAEKGEMVASSPATEDGADKD
jgi:hypothetical protein